MYVDLPLTSWRPELNCRKTNEYHSTLFLTCSYDRIQPNMWSGAYLCWGKENREAPLRAASPPGVAHGLISNFEIKAFDGCANPYLGLAAIISAGIDGLRRNLSLPEPVGKLRHLLVVLSLLPSSMVIVQVGK